MSPELQKIGGRLESTFRRFNRFKSLKALQVELKPRKSNTIRVTKDLSFKLNLIKRKGRDIILEVSVPKRSVKHKVKARSGRLFFEAIKWRGRVYLLAIRPKT